MVHISKKKTPAQFTDAGFLTVYIKSRSVSALKTNLVKVLLRKTSLAFLVIRENGMHNYHSNNEVLQFKNKFKLLDF